jgi:molybdopterin/thiamine biosynthesis adenylyltransferase/rhodanese-related sulfurtransferase
MKQRGLGQGFETSVREAHDQSCADRPLIDIRSRAERQAGVPSGAVCLSEQRLERACRSGEPTVRNGGFIICAEGIRSLDLVKRLHAQGLKGFTSVAGGYIAWLGAGLPLEGSVGLEGARAERYARHLAMPQVGNAGQSRLLRTRVLLAGLGGLNSPVALYLAAAGVGTLGLADFDTIERSNLQRQVIFDEEKLGAGKAASAAERVRAMNPDVETVLIDRRIDSDNASGLVRDWDIVVDGTDSFESRYAVNDACTRHGVPMVYGSVMRFQGQVSVFWPAADAAGSSRDASSRHPCFRCLLPEPPPPEDAPGCAEAGVLGILPGIVGTLQANEALKLALGIGRPLIGRLLMIDALNMDFREARIAAVKNCPSCSGPGGGSVV